MSLLDDILNILDEKGELTLSSLYIEIQKKANVPSSQGEEIQFSQIKSVLERQKELFEINNEMIKISPYKHPVKLNVSVSKYPGPWYKVEVDFQKGTFYFFEWHLSKFSNRRKLPEHMGDIKVLRKEILRLKLWKWQKRQAEHKIELDETTWSIVLTTKAKVYEIHGVDHFPKEWNRFCLALTQLTGKRIC